jgi:hypothetical protein
MEPIPGHMPLHEIATHARQRSPDAFARAYGDAFLVMHTGQLEQPSPLDDTRAESVPGGVTAEILFSVATVAKRPEAKNLYPHITVGRAANNDVVVPDTTVSSFHAFFRHEDDRFFLQDAGSRNGTFVGEQKIAARGEGDAVELGDQTVLRFGSVTMTFLRASSFLEVAERLQKFSGR